MRRLVVLSVAGALLLPGCADRPPRTTDTVTALGTTVAPSARPLDGTTTTDISPVVTTPVTTATTQERTIAVPTTVGDLAEWRVCANPERGYSIGYPDGWHTAYGCRYLDPEPLDITPNSDGFFSALAVVAGYTSFDEALRRTNDRFFVLLRQEETTVGDTKAVRYEVEATGEGLLDKGSRLYSLIIDNDGRAFEVLTVWFPGTSTAEYQLRKKLVDEVVATVRFL